MEGAAAPGSRLLTVEDVSFGYGVPASRAPAPRVPEHLLVLQHLNLSVRSGEFLCLLGPSGCGKSTLLQLILGFLRPQAGSIRLGDAPVTGPGPDRAFVSQQSTLYPWLTVTDNVALPLRLRGVAPHQCWPRVHEVLQRVGLSSAASLWPYQLSGGMVQRVMVARALIQQPQLLLMDEPFTALDAYHREHMQREMLQLWHSTGMTVLFTTHDLREAVSLATRVVILGDRPAHTVHQETFTFGRSVATGERTLEDAHASPEFVSACRRLREIVHAVAQPVLEAQPVLDPEPPRPDLEARP